MHPRAQPPGKPTLWQVGPSRMDGLKQNHAQSVGIPLCLWRVHAASSLGTPPTPALPQTTERNLRWLTRGQPQPQEW